MIPDRLNELLNQLDRDYQLLEAAVKDGEYKDLLLTAAQKEMDTAVAETERLTVIVESGKAAAIEFLRNYPGDSPPPVRPSPSG